MKLTHISKKSKSIAVTAFILGVAAVSAGTFNGNIALADTNGTDRQAEHLSKLITALSQKFNLNSTEVKSVIDTVMTTERADHQATQAQNLAARLAKGVADGKITQAQSALITAKIQENKIFMESLANKTQAEKQTAMKAHKDEVQKWATNNSIPKEFFGGPMQGKGEMGRRGMGRGSKGGNDNK